MGVKITMFMLQRKEKNDIYNSMPFILIKNKLTPNNTQFSINHSNKIYILNKL